MPVIGTLVKMYRAEGIDICTGLASYDFRDMPSTPFTRFIKDGRNVTDGLGIAMQEIYLLENIFSACKPGNIFIIGNSLGWSTLAIGLLLPDSRVIAIDTGWDDKSRNGLELTNRMAAKAGLPKVKALRGVSPQDVNAIADAELGGRIDFAFIDGLHTNEQIVIDYQAVRAKAADDAVYLFHDVHIFNLYPGLQKIEALAGRKAQSLRSTPSGMAVLYDPAKHPGLAEAIAPFAPTKDALSLVQDEAQHYGFISYLKRRLKSSMVFMKSLNAVCRLAGAKPYPLPVKS